MIVLKADLNRIEAICKKARAMAPYGVDNPMVVLEFELKDIKAEGVPISFNPETDPENPVVAGKD